MGKRCGDKSASFFIGGGVCEIWLIGMKLN